MKNYLPLKFLLIFILFASNKSCTVEEEIDEVKKKVTTYIKIYKEVTDVDESITDFNQAYVKDVLIDGEKTHPYSSPFDLAESVPYSFNIWVYNKKDNTDLTMKYSGTVPRSVFDAERNSFKVVVNTNQPTVYVNDRQIPTPTTSYNGLIPGTYGRPGSCTTCPGTGTGAGTGGSTAGACPIGTWKTHSCNGAANKFLIYHFASDGTGYASNPDCNDICTPMIFKFKYSISGNKITYNFTSTEEVNCGGTSSKPNVPTSTQTITFTCGNNGNQLITESSNIQTGVRTSMTFTRQ
ncbi:hypothetical protein [Adhaeribacter aquaticus]|uniref:hypothetical protein n=1 Tax=Adhaeribacter aquaticus TaxID=299567 RepID=UPI000410F52A|nr:hypothetical protein [Adhaeribacter aquaticus]